MNLNTNYLNSESLMASAPHGSNCMNGRLSKNWFVMVMSENGVR